MDDVILWSINWEGIFFFFYSIFGLLSSTLKYTSGIHWLGEDCSKKVIQRLKFWVPKQNFKILEQA